MSNRLYEAGDVKIIDVRIKSRSTGGEVALLDQAISFSIFEDITQPSLVAEFIIQDGINLLHDLPIIGEEDITVEFVTPGLPKPIKFVFQVVTIESEELSNNNKMRNYTLKCVSREHFVASRNNVCKSFVDTIDQMVSNIVAEYFETSKPISMDPCKGNHTIVMPYIPAMVAIDMLRRRAVHPKHPSSSFVFFENQDGYNFRCIEQLLHEGKGDVGTRVFNYQNDASSNKVAEARSFRTIIDYAEVGRSDTNEKVGKGGLYNVVKSYDFVKKKVTARDIVYQSEWPGFQKSDPKSRDQITSKLVQEHGSKPSMMYFVPVNSLASENYIPDMIGRRLMYTTFLNQQTVRILIHGDTAMKVGLTVDLNLPEPEGTTQRQRIMKYKSGRYLVKTLRHIVTLGAKPKHQIAMDCIKVGYLAS